MTELLKQGAEVVFADAESALLNHAGWLYSMSAKAPEAASRVIGMIPDTAENVTTHEQFYLTELNERFGFNSTMPPCYQTVYTGGPLSVPDVCEIRPLTMAELPIVCANYRLGDDRDYIASRIEAGMLGAFIDGQCAGFIGTHDEGSMGMLEVLPQYRRRGIATALEAAMINDRLAHGRVPFGQIFEGNEASLELQRKMGMTVCRGRICWRYREE